MSLSLSSPPSFIVFLSLLCFVISFLPPLLLCFHSVGKYNLKTGSSLKEKSCEDFRKIKPSCFWKCGESGCIARGDIQACVIYEDRTANEAEKDTFQPSGAEGTMSALPDDPRNHVLFTNRGDPV